MFEYSILIGLLSNSPKEVSEPAVSCPSDPIAQLSNSPQVDDPISHSPIANICPAEFLPSLIEWRSLTNSSVKPELVSPKQAIVEPALENPTRENLQPHRASEQPESTSTEIVDELLMQPLLPSASPPSRSELGTEERLAEEMITNPDLERLDDTVDEPQESNITGTEDPELGDLLLRERELIEEQEEQGKRDPDEVFLIGSVDYFRSDNIFLDDFDPINDQLVRGRLSLLAVPDLGPQTQLTASVSGSIARYGDLSDSSYNDIEFRAGIRQFFLPRTYGEVSWRNQQFFDSNNGDRFLNDHSIRLSLNHREYLGSDLTLNGFYQLRLGFADPSDRSRISNTLGVFLNYDLRQDLDVGLDYQVVLTDFTRQQRQEDYHQVTAQVSYDLNPNSRVSLYGGFSFGQSTDPEIDFDSSVFGIVFDVFVPLF